MKKVFSIAVLILIVVITSQGQFIPVLGGQRAGTSSAQFLKIGVGARATAMGESFVAVANDASALFWNPAGITQFSEDQIIVSHTNWLVDIRHQFLGGVYHITSQDAIGLSVTVLHMDDMPVTTEVQPFGTGEYFRFGDLAVGLTYGRILTNQFSFGATIKYIEETMDLLKMRGVTVDLGTYYMTGLGTSRFSAVVTNFGNQIQPSGSVLLYGGQKVNSFEKYSPPTIFKFGFAFEPISDESNMLTTSIQLNHPNDNSENLSVGTEYTWMKIFSLRGGYKFNVDEQTFSFGAGVVVPISSVNLSVDYGYATFDRLGNVQRLSLLLRL